MDTRQRARFRNSLIIRPIVAALCLSMFLCAAFLLRSTLRARLLFSQLETLQLGHSSFEEAQRLARQIHAKPTGPCDRSSCEWEARVDNAELPQWWRGSGEAFLVSYNVENSVVVRKNTGFGIGTKPFYVSQVGLIEQENWGRTPRPRPVAAGWQTTELYRYYSFGVYMTPEASAEDRRRYTAFNFNCFWKYKGCKDGRELLPIADQFPSNTQ